MHNLIFVPSLHLFQNQILRSGWDWRLSWAEETLITSSPSKPFISRLKSSSLGQGWKDGGRAAQHDTGPHNGEGRRGPRPISIFACGTAATTGGPHTAAEMGPVTISTFYVCMTQRDTNNLKSTSLKIKSNELVVTKMPQSLLMSLVVNAWFNIRSLVQQPLSQRAR